MRPIPSALRFAPSGMALLVGLRLAMQLPFLLRAEGGWLRLPLLALVAIGILLRPKPAAATPLPGGRWIGLTAAGLGAILVLLGVATPWTHLEWPGLLLLLWAALQWQRPAAPTGDSARALLLLFLAQPLPEFLTGPLAHLWRQAMAQGAGGLLLGLDIDVWTEWHTLYTGFLTFEMPLDAGALGMVATGIAGAVGIAMLNRFGWREMAGLLLLTLVQALLLSITSVAAWFIATPSAALAGPHANLLHQIFFALTPLLLLLTAAEALVWRLALRDRVRTRIATRAATQQSPPVWIAIHRRYVVLILLAAAATGIALTLYRNRPQGRQLALERVTANARDAENWTQTLHLTAKLLEYKPGDPQWLMTHARTLLLLQRHDEALTALAALPKDLDTGLIQIRLALQVQALTALNRFEEAVALAARTRPGMPLTDPRAAMVLAEMAYRAHQPAEVDHYVRVAARRPSNAPRIRRMYPLLRTIHAWETLTTIDTRAAHSDPATAFIVMEAHMNLFHTADVSRMTRAAMQLWPRDARLLEPLFYLVMKAPSEDWPSPFASHLRMILADSVNPDGLYAMFAKTFAMGRPDLAWTIFERIRSLDASHPALAMAVAEFGPLWFTFQKQFFGLPSSSPGERIDLRPLYLLAHRTQVWQDRCTLVPLGETLSRSDFQSRRADHLKQALAAFEARRTSPDGLSLPMQYLQVRALQMSDQPDAADQRLQAMAREHPTEAASQRIRRSEIAEQRGDWASVYELLRAHNSEGGSQLPEVLRLVRAQRHLKLLPAADRTSRLALARDPHAAAARTERALTLLAMDAPDQALHLLTRRGLRHSSELDRIELRALLATQRYVPTEAFSRSALLPLPAIPEDSPQTTTLPPAEQSLAWHTGHLPDAAAFAAIAAEQATPIAADTGSSPFLNALRPLWLEAYRTGPDDASSAHQRWINCGRDPVEQALALHELTRLLCRQNRTIAARFAAQAAVERLPDSPGLWLWLISLTAEPEPVIRTAFQHCPNDPEIWLARLTLMTRQPDEEALRLEVARVAGNQNSYPPYPVEALTRATDLLLRLQRPELAAALGRKATANARGLLPADITGIRTAIAVSDRTWALAATRSAIAASLRPAPALYRKFVEIKAAGQAVDTSYEMVEILRNLRREDPTNRLWIETLGYVHFSRGHLDTLDAMELMGEAIEAGTTNDIPYLIAAEAARRLEKNEDAISYLRRGLARHPDATPLRNNLAYILARTPGGLSEATTLAATVAADGEADARYLETAADIFIRAGRTRDAEPLIARLESTAEPGSHLWFRARLHRSVMALRAGNIQQAADILNEALENTDALPEDDRLEARRMLTRWQERLQAAQP